MLDWLLTDARTSGVELHDAIVRHVGAVRATAGRGDRRWVVDAEAHVIANPGTSFAFNADGLATLNVGPVVWHAGTFEVVSIAELRALAKLRQRAGASHGSIRLWLLDGVGPATDIGSLQATANPGTLFQVASQFNCLESPGPRIVPVADYVHDPTQGPRASISAFPGTLLRHYAAPGGDGDRFIQTPARQIDLLARACGRGIVRDGYLTGHGMGDAGALVRALDRNFDEICVGVHRDVQVALGYDWDGGVDDSPSRRIAQVFTSTVAGGPYGAEAQLGAHAFASACRTLLRAAYLGTLLAAIAFEQRRVVLTLVGGGAFRNPVPLIWQSIAWAVDECSAYRSGDLDVVVNGRDMGRRIDMERVVQPVV